MPFFGDRKTSLGTLRNKVGFNSEERCEKVKGDPLLRINIHKNLGKLKNAAQDYVSKEESVAIDEIFPSRSPSPKPEKTKPLNGDSIEYTTANCHHTIDRRRIRQHRKKSSHTPHPEKMINHNHHFENSRMTI